MKIKSRDICQIQLILGIKQASQIETPREMINDPLRDIDNKSTFNYWFFYRRNFFEIYYIFYINFIVFNWGWNSTLFFIEYTYIRSIRLKLGSILQNTEEIKKKKIFEIRNVYSLSLRINTF